MMKIIELDTFVEDTAILYREVQDKESEMFKSYFETITYVNMSNRTYRLKNQPSDILNHKRLYYNKSMSVRESALSAA